MVQVLLCVALMLGVSMGQMILPRSYIPQTSQNIASSGYKLRNIRPQSLPNEMRHYLFKSGSDQHFKLLNFNDIKGGNLQTLRQLNMVFINPLNKLNGNRFRIAQSNVNFVYGRLVAPGTLFTVCFEATYGEIRCSLRNPGRRKLLVKGYRRTPYNTAQLTRSPVYPKSHLNNDRSDQVYGDRIFNYEDPESKIDGSTNGKYHGNVEGYNQLSTNHRRVRRSSGCGSSRCGSKRGCSSGGCRQSGGSSLDKILFFAKMFKNIFGMFSSARGSVGKIPFFNVPSNRKPARTTPFPRKPIYTKPTPPEPVFIAHGYDHPPRYGR